MDVEVGTGSITNGSLSLSVPGSTVVLGSLANFTAVEIEMLEFTFGFQGSAPGTLSGFVAEGRLGFINRSEVPAVDIQSYRAARGPAVIPITGSITEVGANTVITVSPSSYRFFGDGSAAKIDVEIGSFSFSLTEVPEPSTALLLGFGLAALALRRRRAVA